MQELSFLCHIYFAICTNNCLQHSRVTKKMAFLACHSVKLKPLGAGLKAFLNILSSSANLKV